MALTKVGNSLITPDPSSTQTLYGTTTLFRTNGDIGSFRYEYARPYCDREHATMSRTGRWEFWTVLMGFTTFLKTFPHARQVRVDSDSESCRVLVTRFDSMLSSAKSVYQT